MLDRLDGHLSRERLEEARLLVSEIVTNAVEHVHEDGEIEISLRVEGNRLRVEVVDPGGGFELRDRDPRNHRGWGLQFVQSLSDDWGMAADGRNRVWFELTA